MEFHESEDSENDESSPQGLRLDTLPPEIFLHICSFLNAKFVISILSQVCRKFHDVIQDDTTWRMRIFRRWPKRYPLVPPIEDLDWKAVCIAREEQHRMWSDPAENMQKLNLLSAHFGCVNVVQLIENGNMCVSGGRDGYIKLWNLDPAHLIDQPSNLDVESTLMSACHHANAWLWDIAYDSHNQHAYTAGFDCNIKCWDIKDASDTLKVYSLSSPILCLCLHDNLLASGCYGRTVSVFDLRADGTPILRHIEHKKPVLCIVSDDKFIVSGSEDKSVVVYDKVAGKVLKKFELDAFPLSMSYGEGQLILGDVLHNLHVIDPRYGEFNLLYTFPSGHSKKVTGVQHSLGSVITCSTDKTIRILEPNVDPEAIAVVELENEISRISACNNIVASANCDDSITVWVPKDVFD